MDLSDEIFAHSCSQFRDTAGTFFGPPAPEDGAMRMASGVEWNHHRVGFNAPGALLIDRKTRVNSAAPRRSFQRRSCANHQFG